MDGWMLWLVLVGLAIGLVAAWLLLVRLPRDESDVDAAERREEAAWIGRTIEQHGGIAPRSLVEEILDLHQAYLHHTRVRRETQDAAQQPTAPRPYAAAPRPPQPSSGPPAQPPPSPPGPPAQTPTSR